MLLKRHPKISKQFKLGYYVLYTTGMIHDMAYGKNVTTSGGITYVLSNKPHGKRFYPLDKEHDYVIKDYSQGYFIINTRRYYSINDNYIGLNTKIKLVLGVMLEY